MILFATPLALISIPLVLMLFIFIIPVVYIIAMNLIDSGREIFGEVLISLLILATIGSLALVIHAHNNKELDKDRTNLTQVVINPYLMLNTTPGLNQKAT